jgi:hypothetical protein
MNLSFAVIILHLRHRANLLPWSVRLGARAKSFPTKEEARRQCLNHNPLLRSCEITSANWAQLFKALLPCLLRAVARVSSGLIMSRNAASDVPGSLSSLYILLASNAMAAPSTNNTAQAHSMDITRARSRNNCFNPLTAFTLVRYSLVPASPTCLAPTWGNV